jgi:hypothetical protein
VGPLPGLHDLQINLSLHLFLGEFVIVELHLLAVSITLQNVKDRSLEAIAHAEKTLLNISWQDVKCLFDVCRATQLDRKEKLLCSVLGRGAYRACADITWLPINVCVATSYTVTCNVHKITWLNLWKEIANLKRYYIDLH